MDKIRRALIVGGSSDIGKAVAKIYLENNYDVLCTSREGCLELKAGIKQEIGVDLSRVSCVRRLESIAKSFAPSCLVYLPGMIDNMSLEEITTNSLIQVFMCNTFAYWLCIKACKGEMSRRGFGRFCSVSSIGSKFGGAKNRLSYTVSKSNLEFFPREFKELGRSNVYINNIICGVTDTKMLLAKDEEKEQRAQLIPVGRLATPGEIADEIYRVCSELNKYRHCSNTTVSGGE